MKSVNFVISLFFAATLSLCTLSLSATASAEEFVVATIDMNRILNESKGAQSKKDELDKISEKKKKELEAKKVSLKKLEDKLKKEAVAPESEEADEYRERARDLARLIKDAEEDLKRKYLTSTRDLTQQARGAISKYAEKKDISMVFDRSIGMRGPILYGSASMDITDEILKELNK